MSYLNRQDAGRKLAAKLREYRRRNVAVFALPRGGTVLGAEIAKALHAPLGLILVRKLGHPYNPEYAVGALAEDHDPVYDTSEVSHLGKAWLREAVNEARAENERRRELYDSDALNPIIQDKTIILVDDGIATGWTMLAALHYIQSRQPKEVIVAVPVASADSVNLIRSSADKIVVLEPLESFDGAVGSHYLEFNQVGNEEVRQLLREVNDGLHQSAAAHR